ncbi:MAG: NADH-quinone oxidoreductase subunit D [Actinobacteria bacterium]|nr:NADH-quinone oxidoreductase subunit D [Actinomycetota bacterium]MCB9411350.1 NADH-quinone oxidoreductase subunit D [Actinomycetota bacterium]
MERIRWELPRSNRHPAAAGGLMLELEVADGQVCRADPIPGREHRGAEKLFESRDYRSLLALANRHDWLGSFTSELGLAQLLEAFLGIEVPERARWIRTLLAEYTRMAHHLLWLSSTLAELTGPASPQAMGPVRTGHLARRLVLDGIESYSGTRMHPMLVAIGGLRADYPDGWLHEVQRSLPPVLDAAAVLRETYLAEDLGLTGLAPLSRSAAWDYSTSGPVARASGVGFDLRLDRPDECYQALIDAGSLRRVESTAGDAQTRLLVLTEQLAVSADCVRQCTEVLAEFDDGEPVNVDLPRSIRLPEGHGYAETENPGGINGWYLVSRGGTHPYRVKLRTGSYNNAAAMAAALPGTTLEQLPAAVFSFLLLAGDVDK